MVTVAEDKGIIDMSFLGWNNPEVIKAAREGLERWIVAASATRKRDKEFDEPLSKTPFCAMVMDYEMEEQEKQTDSHVDNEA